MWKNWTIGTKIVIGFSVVLTLLALVGYEGYSGLLTVMDRAGKANDMQVMVKNLLEARRHEKNLIIRKQPEWRDKTLKATEDVKKLALLTKERFRQESNKKLMDDVVSATNDYEVAFKSLAELVLAGGEATPEQAAMDKKMVAAARTAQEKCENAIKDQNSEMKKASTAALRKIVFLSGIALLLGALSAFLIIRIVTGPLAKMRTMIQDIAQGEGDLTKRLDESSKDEMGEVCHWFNLFIEKIHGIIGQIANTSNQVATAANQLHSTAEHIATGAEEVAAQASNVATAGEEMSATSGDIAQNCQMAAEGAQRASQSASNGAEVVERTVSVMGQIAAKVQETAKTVESLGARSDQIGAIIGTIEDIADQTNLLALNAAIEAARAGEQGRGFAVVADEVRALAERTTRATREIGEMIKAIQGETKGAVTAMEQGVHQVETGTIEAAKSGEALQDILNQVNDVAMQVNQIATAAEEQTATTSEISSNMLQITEVVQQTSQGAHESATAAAQLSGNAEELQRLVQQFKL